MTRKQTNGPGWLSPIDTPEGVRWEVIKIHQRTLGEMFRLADQEGKTPLEIAELLTNDKTFVRGKSWTRQNADALLRNEDVCGNEKLGYPTVVARDVFDRVQARLKAREGGRKGEMTPNLFRGKVFCECGSKAKLKNPGGKKTTGRSYFVCSDTSCDSPKHPYMEVERVLLEWIQGSEFRDEFMHSEVQLSDDEKKRNKSVIQKALDLHDANVAANKQAKLGPHPREELDNLRRRLADERSNDVEEIYLLKKVWDPRDRTDTNKWITTHPEDPETEVRIQSLVLYGDEQMRSEALEVGPSSLFTEDGGIVLEYYIKNFSRFGKR